MARTGFIPGFNWSCLTDSAKFKKVCDKEHVFDFLLGLNKELDEVRERVLSVKPFPEIKEAFTEVRHKEARQRVMLGQKKTNPTSTTEPPHQESTLVVKKNFEPSGERDHGVTITNAMDTPKIYAGKFTGSQHVNDGANDALEKAEASQPHLEKKIDPQEPVLIQLLVESS